MQTLKFILIVFLAQTLVWSAGAQDSSRWSFLARGGYNWANMAGTSAQNTSVVANNGTGLYNSGEGGTKPRMGWLGGVGADFRLAKRVFVQLGLNLEAKGGAAPLTYYFPQGGYSSDQIPASGKSVYALNYLDFPLEFILHVGRSRHLYLGAGIYYGYLVSGKEHGQFSYTEITPGGAFPEKDTYTSNIVDNYNRNDFGYTGTIGWEHPMVKKRRVFIELSGEGSMITLGSSEAAGGKPEIFNQSISLSVGYGFGL